jgi:hypothetical protein
VTSIRLLRQAVLDLLDAAPGLNVFDGEVATDPPRDPDGRVHPYAVLYASPGAHLTTALDGLHDLIRWSFQVTAVGGDAQRCAWAVDTALTALLDQRPTVAGAVTARVGLAGDPGPARRDDDVHPPRHWTPLLFELTAIPA